jgi:hypothetical protein
MGEILVNLELRLEVLESMIDDLYTGKILARHVLEMQRNVEKIIPVLADVERRLKHLENRQNPEIYNEK